MGRWEPDARGRLASAALDLYLEQGYEQTTVAEIAARAGVTERTFFRYFADKREVLFSSTSDLPELLVTAVAEAPAAATPLDAVQGALGVAAERFFEPRSAFARRRQRVLAANAPLQERELIKLASLAGSVAKALEGRGATASEARMAAEAGMVVLRVAFDRWAGGDDEHLEPLLQAGFDDLRTAVGRR